MTPVTENDMKRLEDLIIASREENRQRFTAIESSLGELKSDVKALDEKVQGIEIKLATVITKTEGLKERVDDINGRLNIMTVGFLSIVGILVTGILTAIAKLVFFPNP